MPIWALCAGSTAVSGALGVAAHRTYDAGVADVGDDLDRVGRAEALTKLGFGGRSARVAGASCVRFDLPHPWATQACFTGQTDPPTSEQLTAALDWLEQQSPAGWVVVVRAAHVEAVQQRVPLRVELALEVWATRTRPEERGPAGLEIDVATSQVDVLRAYGAELEPLVRGRIGQPDDTWLVAREHGLVVACARVRHVAGTAYVSAVTVRPPARGRGVGRAISAAATRLALDRAPLAWLECDADVAPLYARLGYTPLTAHVHLRAR